MQSIQMLTAIWQLPLFSVRLGMHNILRVFLLDTQLRFQYFVLDRDQIPISFNVVGGANTKRVYYEGDLDAGLIFYGQVAGLAHDIPSMQEVLDLMIAEAEGVVNRFATD